MAKVKKKRFWKSFSARNKKRLLKKIFKIAVKNFNSSYLASDKIT